MASYPHAIIGQLRRHLQSRFPHQSLQGAFQLPATSPAILPKRDPSIISFGVQLDNCSTTHRRHRSTRLFQSMNFSGAKNGEEGTPTTSAEEEDDPLKWEKMYAAPMKQTLGELNPQTTTAPPATSSDTATSTKSGIRVVTFDLDNTIWKTSATLSDANDALVAHLKEAFGIEERSEKRMGQLFKRFPDRYAGVDFGEVDFVGNGGGDGENLQDGDDYADLVQNVGQSKIKFPTNTDDGVHIQASFGKKDGGEVKKKPVYLTLLRKDAIQSLILEAEGTTTHAASAIDLEHQVDLAFEVWMEARCQSISRNFAPSAVSTLTNLRSQLAPDMSQNVYIGAITDGNSNPDRVPELSGIFDFVIRAEEVGASKPDTRVYKAAVAALMLRLGQDGRSVEEFFLGDRVEEGIATATYLTSDLTSTTPSWKDIEEEAVEAFSEAVGPWWVHVGDDFFKDVVAAKEFQMRTVWTRELIGGSDQKDKTINGENKSEKAQRSVTDLMNDISKSDGSVLKMSIGESEFLTQSLHEEFSDATLDRFSGLSGLLMQWHEEGKVTPSNDGGSSLADRDENMRIDTAVVSEINELDKSRAQAAAIESDRQPTTVDVSESAEGQPLKKFCVFCGGKLPVVAKFCSNCGERQI